MRSILIIPALALALGCKKSGDSSSSTAATLQFTVNGTLYQMNGSPASSRYGAEFVLEDGSGCGSSYNTIYSLIATDSVGDSFVFNTGPAISLSVTTYKTEPDSTVETSPNNFCTFYTLGTVTVLSISPIFYSDSGPQDYTTIVVTSIHNDSLADGTFSGQLTSNNHGTPAAITITNGQFKNIPIAN